uniref:Uncharacterized protein n=1 Tax=Chromera velia CCMP2878 TaxID=1169474 RepID=A0A0G4HUG0_9ALVE|eukprot:Cvel_31772.t1-p1 / transcript=Cvel_31772.t1 / gene=Cvel_31772 / organism=Chromera_velia_CCMP2878 / gene_product=Putative ankyrin repeat protein RF_0381, putative / transcript_product=Putative ankyrin repeat protein RF_0381, putative / location=Cvel_scaffold4795:4110-7443(-) / protein_length=597 / sequence_SO=supercontig / SO=protein_coding / is_pseudo=false
MALLRCPFGGSADAFLKRRWRDNRPLSPTRQSVGIGSLSLSLRLRFPFKFSKDEGAGQNLMSSEEAAEGNEGQQRRVFIPNKKCMGVELVYEVGRGDASSQSLQVISASLVPVRQELKSLAESLLEVVGIVQNMDALLGSVEFPDEPTGEVPPSEPAAAASSALLPTEAAAFDRLKKMTDEMRKAVRVEMNTLMNLYYRMDLEPLLALDIGNAIRSFQVMSAEVLRAALIAFMETGEREKREDLELLLKVGAEVDALVEVRVEEESGGGGEQQTIQETALMRAVAFGSMEATEILVKAGAGLEIRREGEGERKGERAIHIACDRGETEIAEFLVCNGAGVDAPTDVGVTPLYYACQNGLTDLVRFLLKRGANANVHVQFTVDGKTPISRAVRNGHKDVAELLLDYGARMDERDGSESSPLFFTVARDDKEIAELLISRGADVNARTAMGTAVLQAAALGGALNVSELLLDKGADLHAINNHGWTGLHWAALGAALERALADENGESSAAENKLSIAKLLVSRGIDVSVRSTNGETALGIAQFGLPEDSPLLAFLRDVTPAQEPVEGEEEEEGEEGEEQAGVNEGEEEEEGLEEEEFM